MWALPYTGTLLLACSRILEQLASYVSHSFPSLEGVFRKVPFAGIYMQECMAFDLPFCALQCI